MCLINARFDSTLPDILDNQKTDYATPYFAHDENFKRARYKRLRETVQYDAAFVFADTQKDRTISDCATGINALKENGVLILIGEKDAGGNRLQDIAETYGVSTMNTLSKHHCKIIVAQKSWNTDLDSVSKGLVMGDVTYNDYGYAVQAGIYGWKKIDNGSELLARYIPENLTGRVADFGCGYGYLSDHALQKNSHIACLHGLDHDHRALLCFDRNMSDKHPDQAVESRWCDLSKGPALKDIDTIIMNPPFHEGKDQMFDLGQRFIQTAYDSLKEGGKLYMVANTHLPYETKLKSTFSSFVKLDQQEGFKVFEAVK